MADESKKFDFEDFLKIYPPLTPKVDKANYKTFSNFFKKKEKEDKKIETKKAEDINNLHLKNIDENEELIFDNELNKRKSETNEDEWYLINKGIDLQNKKKKKNK